MSGRQIRRYVPLGLALGLVLGSAASVAAGYGHSPGGSKGNGPEVEPGPQANRGPNGGAASDERGPKGGRHVIGAWLDAQQEVPTPVGSVSDAHGKFEAALNRRGRNRLWAGNATLTYSGLTGPAVAAHIHMGAFGTAGPVQIALCGTDGTPDCRNGLRTSLSLTSAQMGAIKRGEYYVNVHTLANPPGEIRGQLGAVYRVRANLTTGQERPRPARPRRGATGRLAGYLVRYGDRGHLDTRLTYRRLSGPATEAHIHRGARRQIGPPIVPLCGEAGTPACQSPLVGMHEVRDDGLRALLAGRAYVNVHTVRNRRGEIRGQVRTKMARKPSPGPGAAST